MTDSTTRLPAARIAKAHGIKGDVKLKLYMEDATLLESPDAVYLSETGGDPLSIKIKGRTKKHILAHIEGTKDRTAAEELSGQDLWIDKGVLPAPDSEGEFYIDDLIGLKAINAEGALVGTVIGVDNFGAGDLLDIKPESGDSFYLLFSEDTVSDIDLAEKTVTVDIPEMI